MPRADGLRGGVSGLPTGWSCRPDVSGGAAQDRRRRMEIEIDPAWPEWAAKRPVAGELPGAPFASLATGGSRACRIGTAFAALVLDVDGREN